jgi:imidazolonepropionase-like amidohydrolase
MIIVLWTAAAYGSNEIPAPPQKQPVALVGGTIHTVSGSVIENGTVLFDQGKIADIGVNVTIPSNALRVDITGKHVYPGLIESDSQLGLTEINSVRGTLDFQETGTINPNVRAETAVNPDSERIPVTRANGIALAVTSPTGGLISGMAALIMLDGWTWENMTLKAPVSMVMNWPRISVTAAYGMQQSRDEQRKNIQKQLDTLEKTFRETRAYKVSRDAAGEKGVPFHKTDVRWEAMIPVLCGELPVWVSANSVQEIESAVEWADREQVKMVLFGGAEAPRAADLLKRKNIPVIVTPILRLPFRRDADYDEQFTVPLKLYEAGIPFCIGGGSSMGNERNLPYNAAMAAAYGLPKDEALKSITIYAARILGVEDRVGSLEKGKDATLIVTNGDPLEIVTNVERLYIQGREVDLNNRQRMLYEKYQKKYRQIMDN